MSEMAREAQRAYMKEWRRRNKDKVAANNRRYWERKAQKMAEQTMGESVKMQAENHNRLKKKNQI